MGQIDEMEAKFDWLVAAVKHLLMGEAGMDDYADDRSLFVQDIVDDEDMSQYEFASVINPPEPPPCGHNHQVLVGGVVANGPRCGEPLITTGLVRNEMTPSGQIMADKNPPDWARHRSPGASSKNPGGKLVRIPLDISGKSGKIGSMEMKRRETMRVKDAAETLQVTPRTILNYIEAGKLECLTLPSGYRKVYRDSCERLLSEGGRRGQ